MEVRGNLRIVDAEAESLSKSECVDIESRLEALIQGSFALRLQGGVLLLGCQANPKNLVVRRGSSSRSRSSTVGRGGAIKYVAMKKRKRRRRSNNICINWYVVSSHEGCRDGEEEQNMNNN